MRAIPLPTEASYSPSSTVSIGSVGVGKFSPGSPSSRWRSGNNRLSNVGAILIGIIGLLAIAIVYLLFSGGASDAGSSPAFAAHRAPPVPAATMTRKAAQIGGAPPPPAQVNNLLEDYEEKMNGVVHREGMDGTD